MYHNSVCCNSIRPVFRFQGYGDCRSPGRSRGPIQGNKCDPPSPYGGLLGLSFDPTDTHALLCAVNALPSTKEPQRCQSVQASCSDSPRQSCSCSSSSKSCDSSNSLTAPSTCAPIPCGDLAGQSIPITEPAQQACNCSSHSSSSSQENNNSSQGMSQRGSRRGSVGVSVGAETSSKVSEKSREKIKGLTWIDWGWPGMHDPCPFNQRHTVDDSLIRPEPVGFVTNQEITNYVQEAPMWFKKFPLNCILDKCIQIPHAKSLVTRFSPLVLLNVYFSEVKVRFSLYPK
jgi:hypothetical protein